LKILFAAKKLGEDGCFGKQLWSWSNTFLKLGHVPALVEAVIHYEPQQFATQGLGKVC